jgi:hypothetical protein
MTRRASLLGALALVASFTLVVATEGRAGAEERLSVGLYAPGSSFDGPVARLDFASKLATHLGGKLGRTGVGRAYAKGSDFSAAVQRGELELAVVDARYVAALGAPYRVVAASTVGGERQAPWQVIVPDGAAARSIVDLRGKSVTVPAVGARDDAFLTEVLLEGELPKSHFGKVVQAPDSLSAVAAVQHGRADAAFVPSGVALPAGVRVLQTLSSVPHPVLVALPAADDELVGRVLGALDGFSGDVAWGFGAAPDDLVSDLARRFGRREHRGPMAVPQLTLTFSDLVSGRKFRIEAPSSVEYAMPPRR